MSKGVIESSFSSSFPCLWCNVLEHVRSEKARAEADATSPSPPPNHRRGGAAAAGEASYVNLFARSGFWSLSIICDD